MTAADLIRMQFPSFMPVLPPHEAAPPDSLEGREGLVIVHRKSRKRIEVRLGVRAPGAERTDGVAYVDFDATGTARINMFSKILVVHAEGNDGIRAELVDGGDGEGVRLLP